MPSIEPTSPSFLPSLKQQLGAHGLAWLGAFDLGEDEVLFPDKNRQPRAVAIIGNAGSSIWPVFAAARKNDPDLTLDRWTRQVVGRLAAENGLEAAYPFEGPPFHPFIAWAKRTGTLFSSPIGLTIHPAYGLWIAFRAALLFNHGIAKQHPTLRRPCDDCRDRPCLTSCPVGAFSEAGYDFGACLDHLATDGKACREGGCLARIACPVGREYRYDRPHATFHMMQLLRAQGRA